MVNTSAALGNTFLLTVTKSYSLLRSTSGNKYGGPPISSNVGEPPRPLVQSRFECSFRIRKKMYIEFVSLTWTSQVEWRLGEIGRFNHTHIDLCKIALQSIRQHYLVDSHDQTQCSQMINSISSMTFMAEYVLCGGEPYLRPARSAQGYATASLRKANRWHSARSFWADTQYLLVEWWINLIYGEPKCNEGLNWCAGRADLTQTQTITELKVTEWTE